MRSPWLFLRLAVQNLSRRRGRALLLALCVAVAGGALFSSIVLREAIEESIEVGLSRMGADLLVVPRATTTNLTTALLTAEPTEETFPASVSATLARLPGVRNASPQRYYALTTGETAHGHEEMIAFDPATDFTVISWLSEKLDRTLKRGDVIVGGRRAESVGEKVNLFGEAHTVYGKLALTGIGPFERSLFTSFETAADIGAAANRIAGRPLLDTHPDRHSALLIRLDAGTTPEQIRFAAANMPEIKVVTGSALHGSVRQGLSMLLSGAVGLTVLMLLSTTLMVGALYTGLLAERRRELGLFLAIGLRPRQLVRVILAEAALTTGIGGVCGVLLGVAGILIVNRSLGYYFESLQIPFFLPNRATIALIGAVSVLLAAGVGALGVWLPARRMAQRDPYELVRSEG